MKTIFGRDGLAILALCLLCLAGRSHAALPLDTIRLPAGFSISLFADDLPNARSMVLGDKGTLFVGTRTAGKVYALKHDGKKVQQRFTIASGLNMPNGVAFKNGALYVMEIDRLTRFDQIEEKLADPGKPVLISAEFPDDKHHGWKFIRFGPDGLLYIPIGAPCNICERADPYASITRIAVDQPNAKPDVFARGIRNSVGFDWHPVTGMLWFTDNGRDMMGDEIPAEEINRIERPGMHFGYPYCHAGDVSDPEFGKKRACSEFIKPEVKLDAHSAALGMRFYTGSLFPQQYRNQIFVAQHGSWNRSQKVGYQIIAVQLPQAGSAAQPRVSVFAEGWLGQGDKVWGRPVDVLVMPDGALLISDDYAGAIYRVDYAPGT